MTEDIQAERWKKVEELYAAALAIRTAATSNRSRLPGVRHVPVRGPRGGPGE